MLSKKNILPSRKINANRCGVVDIYPNACRETETSHFFTPGFFSENTWAAPLLYDNVPDESMCYSKPILDTAIPYFKIAQMLMWHMNVSHHFTYKTLTPEANRKSPRLELYLPQ